MTNYIDMLKEEFLERKKRRPSYSERAFARDLKLSSGFISLLFNGKRSLSLKTSLAVIRNIGWAETESQKFLRLVQESQFNPNPKITKKQSVVLTEEELSHEEFRLISNIKHFAVLEFIQCRTGSTIDQICQELLIEKIECEMIVSRLIRLSMIKMNNQLLKADNIHRKIKSIPSEAIRNYHRQAIDLAANAIEAQGFDRRELRALTLCMDPKKIPNAKKEIDDFFTKFKKKYANVKNGEVYQLNTQLFSHHGSKK